MFSNISENAATDNIHALNYVPVTQKYTLKPKTQGFKISSKQTNFLMILSLQNLYLAAKKYLPQLQS